MVVKARHAKRQRLADWSTESDFGSAALVIAACDIGIAVKSVKLPFCVEIVIAPDGDGRPRSVPCGPFRTSTCPISSVAAKASIVLIGTSSR